jgi:hypothetical protein
VGPILWLVGVILMGIGAQPGEIISSDDSSEGPSASAGFDPSGYPRYSLKRKTPGQPGLVGIGVASFLVGMGIIFASNWWIQTVYGGKVWGATPSLFGFEGTLPLRNVERKVFGNAIGRLQYAPSSGRLCEREVEERIGKGPAWIETPGPQSPVLGLPVGHQLFTLVDTGPSMAVHVFSAVKPPSVALICGKEGGMLRVALCSYERSTNCLHKETVVRMETPMLSLTTVHGWLKLA